MRGEQSQYKTIKLNIKYYKLLNSSIKFIRNNPIEINLTVFCVIMICVSIIRLINYLT